jgi:hypothetical protein
MTFAPARALIVAGSLALAGCGQLEAPVIPLAQGETNISGLAVDEFSLYFIKNDGAIKRVPLDGGPAEPLAVSDLVDPRHIAIDGDHVYLGTTNGTVARVPRAGGEVETLLAGQPKIMGLTVELSRVYFAAGNAVRRLDLAAGDEETALAQSAVVDGTLTKSAGSLYWVGELDEDTSGILSVPAGASGPVEPAVVQPTGGAFGVDGSFLYWAATNVEDPKLPNDTLYRKRQDGSETCEIARADGQIYRIVGDEDNVYWTTLDGAVSTAPTDCGATPFVFSFLSEGEGESVFLAQDAVNVYYARSKTGSIWSRPKASIVAP